MTPGDRGQAPLVVLDDDPTGTQAVADTPVLLEWDAASLARAVRSAPAVHLLTNSRAYPPERAYAVVREAAETAVRVLDGPRLLLRGDSTLRGHLLEEFLAVRDGRFGGRTVPLLLVPALPAAGRITVGGVHLIERDGVRTALHETEYARDPSFSYSDASLLAWADERSRGLLPRADGRSVPPEAGAVREALLELQGRAAAVAPDAETITDLRAVAEGLRAAEAEGAEVIVRSAPAFAGVLGGNLAVERVTAPRGARLLVVCGSFVPTTRRQLSALVERHPTALVEVDVRELGSTDASSEMERAAGAATRSLDERGLAILATPRERAPDLATLDAGERIADNLARTAGLVVGPDVVVSKGGITSAVTARVGFGARTARCLGPLVDGVALWELERSRGARLPFVVFPGNVGQDGTLLEVVEQVRTS
jgi:uncharacterized protein YgbK (DUF1537 family)